MKRSAGNTDAVRCRVEPGDRSAIVSRRVVDERGASIVIALVFFLICAIIGSVVMTAASVHAKAVQTNRALQQAELTIGSAAQLVGTQFSSMVLNVDDANQGGSVVVDLSRTDQTNAAFAIAFWNSKGSDIWSARDSSKPYSTDMTGRLEHGNAALNDVAGTITVDSDLNVKIELALANSTDGSYRESVLVQCVPTFDQAGRLTSFSYEAPVITKRDRGGA